MEYYTCVNCKEKFEGTGKGAVEFITVVGNITANGGGGLVGNGDWKENGVPETTICTNCLSTVLYIDEYQSERRLPLITQNLDPYGDSSDKRPWLTMENYLKWYTMYLIHIDGKVEKVSNQIDSFAYADHNGNTWYDHCPTPAHFHLVAKALGARYDNETFAAVCAMLVSDVLDDDWSKLARHLPQGD